MKPESKIFVAGHGGLVGSAIVRALQHHGFNSILTRTRSEVDLSVAASVAEFFRAEKPEYVFLAAAKVGGIHANNTYPADFIRENLQIETNVIHESYRAGVIKLCFLGSSCIYPKFAPQPLKEEYLLSGNLEPTNEPYAIAKIAGIKMCEAYNRQYGTHFISLMPTNLYGPYDNFDPLNSHVLPALIRKFVDAKREGQTSVTLWGTGTPRREFLHVDDLAEACLFLMGRYESSEIINVGTGEDISIHDLAKLIAQEVGFEGTMEFDNSRPDGTPRKLLDVSRIRALGWQPTISLREGIRTTIAWYRENVR